MMNSKVTTIIILACVLISAPCSAGEIADDNSASIYLPREVEVDVSVPTLGRVSIIRGDDSFVEKAGKIPLGKMVRPGQSLVINRTVLLGRLASNGIMASDVKLTGAEEMLIKQRGIVIKQEQLIELAKAYLIKNPPVKSVCELQVVRGPEKMLLKGMPKDVKLSPRVVISNVPGLAKVEIGVIADGVRVGQRDVTFRLKYSGRKFVALVDIPVGTVISKDNIKVEKTVVNYPDASDTIDPYGLIAKRRLSANTEIRTNMIGPAEPPIVFKRNQSVMIRIERFGLLVTAMAKALEDGKVGQYVKVQNIDSGRTIVAKVRSDGTVEPTF